MALTPDAVLDSLQPFFPTVGGEALLDVCRSVPGRPPLGGGWGLGAGGLGIGCTFRNTFATLTSMHAPPPHHSEITMPMDTHTPIPKPFSSIPTNKVPRHSSPHKL